MSETQDPYVLQYPRTPHSNERGLCNTTPPTKTPRFLAMATTENEHEEWENEEWEADGEWAEEGESEEGDDDWSDSGDDELSSEDQEAVESQEGLGLLGA